MVLVATNQFLHLTARQHTPASMSAHNYSYVTLFGVTLWLLVCWCERACDCE